MPDTAVASKQRAVASGLQVQLGLMTLIVDAVPVRRPNLTKSGFSFRAPCGTRVSQAYVCTCGEKHGPFKEDELGHGRDVDGTFVAVTTEEYDTAMGAAIPKGEWGLSVYPADQVETLTRPDESAYRLRATKGTVGKVYGVLLAAAADPRYALVGEINLKGAQKPYRLTVWGGMLVAQSIIRPDDLSVPEGIEADAPDARTAKLLEQLLKGELAKFTSDTFRNIRAERLDALDEAKRTGETAVVSSLAAVPEADIVSLLEASLSKAQERKAPRKTGAKPAARVKKAAAA